MIRGVAYSLAVGNVCKIKHKFRCTGGKYESLVDGAPGLPGISRGDAAAFILEGFQSTLRGLLTLLLFDVLVLFCTNVVICTCSCHHGVELVLIIWC
jgi:hypothetical protein